MWLFGGGGGVEVLEERTGVGEGGGGVVTHHGLVGDPLAGVVEQDAFALGRECGATVRAAHQVAQVGSLERCRVLLKGRPCRCLVNCCFVRDRSFVHLVFRTQGKKQGGREGGKEGSPPTLVYPLLTLGAPHDRARPGWPVSRCLSSANSKKCQNKPNPTD